MNHMISRAIRFAAMLAMIAVAMGAGSMPAMAIGAGETTVSATLPAYGGWVAYSFTYPGDGSHMGVKLTYDPVDMSTETLDNAIVLEVYGSDSLPPNGTPIGRATREDTGEKYWEFSSENKDAKGTYVVLVHNWHPEGKPVTIHLTTTYLATQWWEQDTLGPTLSLVSSSEGSVTTAPAPAPAAPKAPAPSPAPAAPSATKVSTTLPAGGGWAAYSFTYPGDSSQMGIELTYSPTDGYTEAEGAITLEGYNPDSLPPDGKPIGRATRSDFGEKYWQFASETQGTYTVVVHNWDPLGRPVTINLSTSYIEDDTESPGPVLTLVASGQ